MKGRILLTGFILGITVCGAIKLLSSKSSHSAKKENALIDTPEHDDFVDFSVVVSKPQYTKTKIDSLRDISERHRAAAGVMAEVLIQKGEDTTPFEGIQSTYDKDFKQIDEELNNLLK